MTPREMKAARARERRRQRTSLIRNRVVVGAVVTFAAAWAVIFGQLVTNHDPALAARTQARTATAQATSGSSGGSTTPSGSDNATGADGSSSSSSSGSSGSPSSASPVTTRQS